MDNINNTQPTEPKENNKKLVIISSIVILALVAVFVIVGVTLGWFGGKKTSEKKATTAAPTISVLESKGSETKTKKIKIKVRDVKFGDSVKKVKKYEKKQEDTQDNPSQASSKDGYTYVTYLFTPKKAEFFGVEPAKSASGALLQYVFKDKKLFDIRIQFGDVSKKDQVKLKKNLIAKFGKPTFSMKYSNKATRDSWRTAAKNPNNQTVLSLNYSPTSGEVVDYMSVKR